MTELKINRMEFLVEFNEIKSLDDLKEKISENLMIQISNMRWVDVNGNELNEDEYKYYNVETYREFDLDYLLDNYDYYNFRRVDLMVEQLDERGLDLFETLDDMIDGFFTWTLDNSFVNLISYDFKLFSYWIK
jgi:hypothetical protein